MNQCDGCRAGIPLNRSNQHVYGDQYVLGAPGRIQILWRDLMSCQAERYATESEAEFLEMNRYPK